MSGPGWRVLIVAQADPFLVGSGAERVLREHVGALIRRGHSVTVLSGHAVAAVHEPLLTVEPVGWSLATPWRVWRRARTLAGGPPDAILLHHPFAGALLSRAPWRGETLLAVVYLSPWDEDYRLRDPSGRGPRRAVLATVRRWIERSVVRRARRVYPMSGFMAERVRALHRLPADRLRVVPGGVDPEHFSPPGDRSALRARLGLPEKAPVLLSLRNLEPRMGLAELLRAVPVVRAAHPGLRVLIGGTGELATVLREDARALELGETVRFLGFVPEAELPALYGAADLFVLPTQALEGFGLVTLESLACGTPVLGTPVGATPELVRPLDPTLVLDAPSVPAIARGILAFLARGDHDALRSRCRAHAAAHTWDAAIAALETDLFPLRGR